MAITEPLQLHKRASFVHDTAGSILTVHIRGEIDHHTAVSIREGIDGLLYERRPRKLVLDLSEVSFMDSSGLGLIMGRLSLVRELGGELVVWSPGRETRSILTLAGMEKLVRIEYPPSSTGTSMPPDRRSGSAGVQTTAAQASAAKRASTAKSAAGKSAASKATVAKTATPRSGDAKATSARTDASAGKRPRRRANQG